MSQATGGDMSQYEPRREQGLAPHAPYNSYSTQMMVAPRVSGAHQAFAVIAAVLTFGYFLPWAIAASRNKSNAAVIGLLNFLAGWTILGWVAAVVISVMSDQAPVQVHTHINTVNLAPATAPPG